MNPKFDKAVKVLQKNSPYILVGIGIAGMGLAVASAIRATSRAKDIIAEMEQEKYDKGEEDVELTKKEIVKETWTQYIPTAIIFTGSAACIIGSSRIQFQRNAALGIAYKIAEDSARTFERKLVEVVGEKKANQVRQEVDKEVVHRHPASESNIVIIDKKKSLALDPITGRLFEIDVEELRRKVNKLNERLLTEMYISLNELYYEIGLPEVDIGDIIGFNVDDGLIDPDFTTQLTDDERPCLVMHWHIGPKYDYGRNM